MKQIKAIIIGAGQRGNAYAAHAKLKPDDIKLVGVAEPHEIRRNSLSERYGIAEADRLYTWENVFEREKWADVVIICTPDRLHYGPAMAAIKQGYDVLVEKPAAPTPEECLDMANAAKEKGVKVVVCHVMRYSPFATTLKEIIDSGEIGEVRSIVHNENVGNIHQSHSFVRGNWGNEAASAPMILAKSCHDMDFLQWLIGKKCVSLSSYGSLSYFKEANAPKGSPARCTDGCKEDCQYDTRKLYLNSKNEWFRSVAAGHFNSTDEEVLEALKTGRYGRCVFKCDNDVVDHQIVSMLFENNITASFSMCAFTPDISRSIKIMGTKGQIKAHTSKKHVQVTTFDGNDREIEIVAVGGHGGGDTGIMNSFCAYINGVDIPDISEIGISSENHMLCFAAEMSRANGGALVKFGVDGELPYGL